MVCISLPLTMDWTLGGCLILTWALSDVSLLMASNDVQAKDVLADFGDTVTLKCLLLKSKTSTQVTWKKNVGVSATTLATYTQDIGARVREQYMSRLNISSTPDLNETAITLFRVSLEDEGSYTCIFNVYPTGAEQGTVHLSLHGQVLIEKQHKAKLGEVVRLKCLLRNPEGVQQVSWLKNGENIAAYTYRGTNIAPTYQNIVSMCMEGNNVTTLNIWKAAASDDGEYTCVFNIFPTGSEKGTTRLHVYSAAVGLRTELLIGTILMLLWLEWW